MLIWLFGTYQITEVNNNMVTPSNDFSVAEINLNIDEDNFESAAITVAITVRSSWKGAELKVKVE